MGSTTQELESNKQSLSQANATIADLKQNLSSTQSALTESKTQIDTLQENLQKIDKTLKELHQKNKLLEPKTDSDTKSKSNT